MVLWHIRRLVRLSAAARSCRAGCAHVGNTPHVKHDSGQDHLASHVTCTDRVEVHIRRCLRLSMVGQTAAVRTSK